MADQKPDNAGRFVPPKRHEPAHRVIIGIDETLQLIAESLLAESKRQSVILKRIERKVNEMAIKFDKLEAAVTKIGIGQEALTASFAEIVAEFELLKTELADIPAAQAKLDSLSDGLSAFGDALATQAQAFKDINPDAPTP